jgi:hypothetical protein
LGTAFEGVVQHLSRLSSTQMCLGLLLFVCAVVGTGARPPNSSQFEIQPPSMFQYLGGLVSANFHWPYNCKAQGCGLSLIYIWHVSPRSSFLSMGLTAACFYLFSLAEQLLHIRVPQDAIGTVFSNRSRVCMFLRNSRLEPYTAVQLSRPAAIRWAASFSILYLDRALPP